MKNVSSSINNICLTVLVFTTLCNTAQNLNAKTLHIDANEGNDSTGTGTIEAPFATWDKARPKIESGDLIILYDGFYGDISEGAGPSGPIDVFSKPTTIEAALGTRPQLGKIKFGANGGSFMGDSWGGTFDLNLTIIGVEVLNGVEIYGAKNLTIKECMISLLPPWTGSIEAIDRSIIEVAAGTNVLIENCDITAGPTAISLRGVDLRARGNHIHDIAHDGIRIISCSNALIENNRIHGLNDGVTDAEAIWSRHCDAIHIFISGSTPFTENNNIVVRGNIIYDIESHGVQFNNFSIRAPELRNRNIIFENNIFGPTGAATFNNADPVDNLIFRHNSFVTGIRNYDSPHLEIKNSITMSNSLFRISEFSTGVSVYNNIFGPISGSTEHFFIMDYNLFTVDQPRKALTRNSLTTNDSVYKDQDEVNGVLSDYAIAVNAGSRNFDQYGPNLDIYGTVRDNRPDIGAYEIPYLNPQAETVPSKEEFIPESFFDDFEDANFLQDPYLSNNPTKGFEWSVVENMVVERNSITRNVVSSGPSSAKSLILSAQTFGWSEYSIRFIANNQYITQRSGPIFFASNEGSGFWLDIGRDEGALYSITPSGIKSKIDSNQSLGLPNSGLRNYFILVKKTLTSITINIDADDDGSFEMETSISLPSWATTDAHEFFGFLEDAGETNRRVQYDNINVTRVTSRPISPSDLGIVVNPTR